MKNNKYQDVMSRLSVTPEMAERILEEIRDIEEIPLQGENTDQENTPFQKENPDRIIREIKAAKGGTEARKKPKRYNKFTYIAAAFALFLAGGFLGLAVGGTKSAAPSSTMMSYSEADDTRSSGTAESYDYSESSADSDYDVEEISDQEETNGYAAEDSADSMDKTDSRTGVGASDQGASNGKSSDNKGSNTGKDVIDGQKLIYSASLQIETLDYQKSLKALKEAIQNAGGYIETENETSNSNSYYGYVEDGYGEDYYETSETGEGMLKENSLVIRIPASAYSSFLEGMTGIGSVISRSQAVDNVTAYYHDTEVQIKALQIQEKRLLDMMEKADTIEDMIRVEQRLTEVQTELDSYESTLKGLDNQVEYARVDISLKEVKKYRVRPEAGFGQKAKSKLQEGFENFVDGVTDLLFGLLYHLPMIILLAIVLIIVHILMKRHGWKLHFRKKEKEEIDPNLFKE